MKERQKPQVYLGAYLPVEVDKEMHGYMKRENRSKSYVARKAISEFLEREGRKEAGLDEVGDSNRAIGGV